MRINDINLIAALAALGVEPKLFLASEDDPVTADAALRLADEAPGDWNLANLVPGSEVGVGILDGPGAGDLVSAVVARLNVVAHVGLGLVGALVARVL